MRGKSIFKAKNYVQSLCKHSKKDNDFKHISNDQTCSNETTLCSSECISNQSMIPYSTSERVFIQDGWKGLYVTCYLEVGDTFRIRA